MIYVGIDPGLHNGLALWDAQDRAFIEIGTYTFWGLIFRLDALTAQWTEAKTETLVLVEYAASHNFMYARNEQTNDPSDSRRRKENKISRNIGQNQLYGKLIVEYLELLKATGRKSFSVTPIVPNQRKLNGPTFSTVTKYPKAVSQHARDAAMLVFGR